MKINKISPEKSQYLQILSDIAKKPVSLYYVGSIPTERQPTVAIVGTRKPTSYGIETTTRFAHELAQRGVVIVSGLALGVDALAHAAALDAGGTTLAVLGNGLPGIQPSTNAQLAKRIIEQNGAVLSEYDEGYPAMAKNFLERNRLVAGLADAVIITEAAARSGTLNTAMHALEQGKDIFVVPGNITSPLSAGCNALIKQGAHVLTDVSDVLEIVLPGGASAQATLPLGQNQLETDIIELIASGERDGEVIQRTLKVGQADFATALTLMELAGIIRSLGGNKWTLR